jgi:alkylhydroperoxidase/carboxymuconolactone decarboxylase family protein YurZ
MSKAEALKQIHEFEAHYKYDGTYMRELLEYSPGGLAKFNNFLPLSSHIEKLSPEDYWVAKLATMQVEDCGECLQLNVRMALEAGVSKALVRAAIKGGNELPEHLKDVYLYAKSVAKHELVDNDLMDRIEVRYDKGSLLEFGICIATAKVFPTIKRAVGYAKACSLIEIEV